jgi:hypothetical protein
MEIWVCDDYFRTFLFMFNDLNLLVRPWHITHLEIQGKLILCFSTPLLWVKQLWRLLVQNLSVHISSVLALLTQCRRQQYYFIQIQKLDNFVAWGHPDLCFKGHMHFLLEAIWICCNQFKDLIRHSATKCVQRSKGAQFVVNITAHLI